MVNSRGLLSRRYSILVADRSTGVVRRFNLSLRPALATVLGLFALPVLVGLGARWSASAELDHLRTATGVLRQENASFRAATGELTGQIASLQDAIGALSEVGQLDPATRTALSTLPALVRNQAKGGAASASADTRAIMAAATSSPEDAFGLLRSALGSLERHLSVTRADVLQRNEVAQATPSIWPAMGWLTSGFGSRSDPFTGRPDSHPGLDISGSTGDPVYATADGRIATAGRTGDYGNLVVIEHAFGLTTRYGHLSKIAVEAGTEVKRGHVIGYVGSTGRSTSSHLHYEVWANGRPVNPLKLLVGRPE
jgi:murein DD-endopeptidase MepM/ murein hydrolase activator NlpD